MKASNSWTTATSVCLAALGAALFVVPATALAQSPPPGIYYDYSQVSVGGAAQFVLVPRESPAFNPGLPPQVSVPQAFRVLRDNKRATYGSASVTLSDADLAAGRVVVHLDPTQLQYSQIVVAETVYTFAALGIDEVSFPGLGNASYGRADVPFAAFVMHLPMWRALPPVRVVDAYVELSDGTHIAADEFYERWDRGDRDLQEQLLSYVTEGEGLAQRSVLGMLTELSLPGSDEAVTQALQSDDASIRLLAVGYLARSDSPSALEQLTALLESDPDPAVQGAAADALGASGDARYQYLELLHALELASGAEIPVAVAALADSGDPRAAEALMPYVSHEDSAVREAAIDGLLVLGVSERVAALFSDETVEASVKEAAAARLIGGEDGPVRVVALEYVVSSHEGPAAVDALYSLRSSSAEAEAMAAIARQLQHPSAEVRQETARLLGQLGTAETLDTLARAAASETEPAVRDELDDAAVNLMTHMPREEVQDLVDGSDLFLKGAAFRTLGQLAQQGQGGQAVFRALSEGLSDPEAEIRGAAVLGLASYGSDDAYQALAPLAVDPDPDVRRSVARALSNFSAGTGNSLLRSFIQDSDEQVIAAGYDTIADRVETDFLPEVFEAIQSPSPVIRASALHAASHVASPEVEQTVIDALMGATNDPEPLVRASAASALGNIDNELAILGISPLTQDRDLSVRLAAIEALGHSGSDSALGVLTSLLRDRVIDVRLAALSALSDTGNPGAVADIERAMAREAEAVVIEAGRRAIQHLRTP